jgi:hypothetical protein
VIRWRRAIEAGRTWLIVRLVELMPREVVYWCALRVLNELRRQPWQSFIAYRINLGTVPFMWALEQWVNEGRRRER